ncbi:hypothetical protein AEQ67_06335 [Pseudomonas sp. RIT-PI-q]|uniref:hypothetical protein n=1 Tax=Pseudomonas sp. RIT-PI-q TaxID=1690247 RepID=UPI0006CCB07D|nr:hypothetical protein [Pseudomonas sp. RIT-PI-q]KPH00928.1 hypothetical protein AEQ67_06335 [Pseudomonas sp. RIT-PI-q]
MSFYSELLDTGYLPACDKGAAKAVLMLRALYEQPTDLTTSHAFSSELIEQCATDIDFRRLVRDQRIRFRLRPGTPLGMSPGDAVKHAMIAAMDDNQYRFENWPELLPDPRTGAMTAAREKRDYIIAVLNHKKPPQPIYPVIDKRLDVLNELFRSIEHSKCTVMEDPRAAAFQEELLEVHLHVPASHPEVKELLRKIGSMQLKSRSEAYNAIDREDSLLGEFAADAKSVVDSVLNKTLASSLGQRLLCIERRVPLMRSFISKEHAVGTSITVVDLAEDRADEKLDRDAAARMKAVVDMKITWADVRIATNDFRVLVHPDDVAEARKKLATAIVEKRFVIARDSALAGAGQVIDALSPKVLEAITPLALVGGGLFAHHFEGGLADFANSMLPYLSYAGGAAVAMAGACMSDYAKKKTTDWRTKQVEQVIKGCMDDCTRRSV